MGTWNLKPAPGLPALGNLKRKNNTYMMKEKRLYQSPWTRRDVVELEDGFCGSIMETNQGSIESTKQTYQEFDAAKEESNPFEFNEQTGSIWR